MAYAIKYQAEFDNLANQRYRLEILRKDYLGDITTIALSGDPVKQSWQTDDPKAPIKGCSLVVGLLNDGNFPLTTFYSINDDEYKARLWWDEDQLLFEGYLVQDDCQELMVDYVHEIALSFNDNLGLLKDVALDANLPPFGGWAVTVWLDFIAPVPSNFVYIYNSGYKPVIGVPFTISGHIDATANATFTPISVTDYFNGNYVIEVAPLSFTNDTVQWPAILEGAGTIDLYQRNTLMNIIRICLYNTTLELDTYIYANIFETSHTIDRSFLEQTFIDTRLFLKDAKFMNCYEVLEIICRRFRMSVFQSNGAWRLMRWDEVRYHQVDKDIPYYRYDSNFAFIDTLILEDNFNTGFGGRTFPEEGLTGSIFRPYQYVKETFNYKQPEFIIRNSNLKDLGPIIGTTSDADYTYTTYEFPESSKWVHFIPGDPLVDVSYIVVKSYLFTGDEVERYVYQPKVSLGGGVGNSYFASVQFNDVQVTKGDTFNFQLRIKAASSTGGDSVLWRFGYILTGNEGAYYGLFNSGPNGSLIWTQIFSPPNNAVPGFNHTVLADDAENYLDYSLAAEGSQGYVPAFPADGVLRIRVYGSNTNSAAQPDVDAIWKDIKLTITQDINSSTNIIGHYHLEDDLQPIKNNEDIEITMDDSPRNSIAGTLYRVEITGTVQNRTSIWYRLTTPSEQLRLGRITSLEQLFWRRLPRTKLQGTFHGLESSEYHRHVGMLAILKFSALPTLNFIFGSLEIDFKNRSFNGTQWEICTDTETDSDLGAVYTFSYIYDNK